MTAAMTARAVRTAALVLAAVCLLWLSPAAQGLIQHLPGPRRTNSPLLPVHRGPRALAPPHDPVRGTAALPLGASSLELLPATPPLLVAGAGDLSPLEVGAYFALLSTLIGVPIFLSVRDQRRIQDFRTKRQNFIDAIEGEIAQLKAEGDDASLATAKELRERLNDVYASIEEEKLKDEDSKYLGFNKYIRDFQQQQEGGGAGGGAVSDLEMASRRGAGRDEEPTGNRYARRLDKKQRKKRKVPK